MVIFCSLPVALSRALTLRMPLASMSKVTSTWGVPVAPAESFQVEAAERPGCPFDSSRSRLQDVNLHGGLVVPTRSRGLLALGRDGWCCARRQLGHHAAAEGLDSQTERRHVEEQEVLHLAAQHRA